MGGGEKGNGERSSAAHVALPPSAEVAAALRSSEDRGAEARTRRAYLGSRDKLGSAWRAYVTELIVIAGNFAQLHVNRGLSADLAFPSRRAA